jgi:hypothetical protein
MWSFKQVQAIGHQQGPHRGHAIPSLRFWVFDNLGNAADATLTDFRCNRPSLIDSTFKNPQFTRLAYAFRKLNGVPPPPFVAHVADSDEFAS